MTDIVDTRPVLKAYVVDRKDDHENQAKGFWHEVGAAWMHKDGKGMTLRLHSLPINGEIVLREPKQPKEIID
jgi:hypothetical protein